MAEPLTNHYGPEIPRRIASDISKVYPDFPAKAFLNATLQNYDTLNLMARGRRIATCLQNHLPKEYPRALNILMASVPEKRAEGTEDNPLSSFLYLPHTYFVSTYGVDHFEISMQAQHLLTRLFTAEFSIRTFLIHHEKRTLDVLKKWTRDPDQHVRRLVSEGTRPRLPWACRLPSFQKNPAPVLELLELLKDDPELYVRRSVANNLNDIGKDHPETLNKLCQRWLKDAGPDRERLIRHALRSSVKKGNPGTLKILGYGKEARVELTQVSISPRKVKRGESVRIDVEIQNTVGVRQELLADLIVHFVKANGKTSAKVFKLNTFTLAPKQSVGCGKKISLADLTTRKHYAGRHRIELFLNGKAHPLGFFDLT